MISGEIHAENYVIKFWQMNKLRYRVQEWANYQLPTRGIANEYECDIMSLERHISEMLKG